MRPIIRLFPTFLAVACELSFSASQPVFAQCTPPPSGLVSWWPGDGDPTDIQDSNNGALYGTATFDAGKVGLAFSFSGNQGGVVINRSDNLNMGTSDFTVDAWVKVPVDAPTGQRIVFDDGYSGQSIIRLVVQDHFGEAFFRDSNGNELAAKGTTALNDGAWHHLAGVRTGTTGLVYVDGQQEGTVTNASFGSISTFCSVAMIGASQSSSFCGTTPSENFFTGEIDEVEFFNRALSSGEIANIFNAGSAGKCKAQCISAPSGLVSWWAGDGDARDLQDSNSGTLQNGVTFVTGKVGQAFSFDGASADIKVPASSSLDVGAGGGLTIDLWINPTSTAQAPLVEWNPATGQREGPHLWISTNDPNSTPGNLFANIVDTGGGFHVILSPPNLILANTYQHVALTYDKASGMATLYRNGVIIAGPTNLGTFTPQTSFDLYFGDRPAGDPPLLHYAGAMDEIEIFNRALSQSEIQSIFDAGSAGKCKAISAEGQSINISTRVSVGTDTNVGIAGFILRSDGTPAPAKDVVVRGIGPSLPVSGKLLDPTLELRDSNGALIASNDNWMDAANASAIQASGLAPTDPHEAAILATLSSAASPGFTNYTAILAGKNNTTGVGLVEVYDLQSTNSTHLVNISTRAFVSTGDDVLIGGVIIRGGTAQEIVLRAIGPELGSRGVSNFLADPTLELHDGQGNLLESNDNWMDSPEKDNIIASGLAPTDDRESAILATLFPGNYTGIVRGVGNTTGVGLVEAYRIGPPPLP